MWTFVLVATGEVQAVLHLTAVFVDAARRPVAVPDRVCSEPSPGELGALAVLHDRFDDQLDLLADVDGIEVVAVGDLTVHFSRRDTGNGRYGAL